MNASFFMIRTKQNRILGPIVKEDLVHRVSRGEMDSMDEICPASGYWVYLHEREEVKKLLGIEPPVQKKEKSEEDTETETQTATATLAAQPTSPAAPIVPTDQNPGASPSSESDSHLQGLHGQGLHGGVERTNWVRWGLYLFCGILVFVLLRIYQLTQS